MLDRDLGGGGIITVGVFYIVHYKYKNRGVQMDKKRMILASLASAAVLGAGFTTVQPLVVKADENAAKPATPKVIQDAEADAKKAEEKVTEAQAKVDAKTTEATAAATKVEAEKKEDADAKAAKAEAEKAKTKADEAKKTADDELTAAKEDAKQADAKAKEEEAKAEAKAKEDADTKKAISDSLDKLVADAEKAINDNKKITDKEKAIKELKEKIGKEDLLAAIEAGEISIDNVVAELNDDAAKAEANEAADKKMRDKDQAAKSATADAGATSKATTDKKDMPADLKATIAEAEKADAARPESEKLQDKADQLDDQLNRVEAQFDEAKKVADEKAAVLVKKETALKEVKEAADIAEKYNLKDEIVKPLKNVVTEIEKDRNEANSEFEQADAAAAYYAEQGKELEAEYNNTVAAVKAAKEEEAKNPKPAEKPVEKPKVKTEAEKAAEAKAEADKKVAAAEAKVAEADAKVNETTKALEEATTKATKEEADVQPAEDAKTAADKAKAEAEDELAKAKEAAVTAKAKVEELKKDEADSLAGLKYALEKMEADAIEKINKDDKITDKDAAIDKAKAAIGKEDLLKAIENGEISASEAARDLDDQAATAEANKNQDPQDNNIGAATPTIESGDKVSEADKKAFAEADKKAAARPESEKIQDRVDQLLKEINYLTAIADKDKAAAEVLLEKFNHAKEVLLEAGQAERAAEEANSNPEVLEALKKVVYNLELDRDTAKQELAKILVPLEAYTEQINKLTDEYNQTLKDLEAAKAAEKVDALKVEIKDLEAELAKDKDNEEISDKLNAMRSALARAEKDLKENPNALVYAVLLPKVDALPTASQALKAEINKLREEKEKTTDDSQKAELEKKIAEKEALLAEVEKAEETPAQPAEPATPAEETPAPSKPSEDAKVEDLQNKVADLEKLVADNENNPDAVDYVTAAKEKLEAKKAELEKAEDELDGKLKRLEPTEENKILDEIDKVKEEIKDAEENEGVEDYYKEGLKNRLADLEEALKILAGNESEVLDQKEDKKVLKVTRYVDIDTNADILNAEEGHFKGKPIAGYTFVKFIDEDGIITNYYRKVDGNYNKGPQIEQQSGRNGGDYPGDRYIINKPTQTPASTPAESSGSATPSTPANETPATPAPGTDTPATPAPAAEAPATAAPAVAGTSQDNTYQAPAAKADDKKELPNTGGKDNVAIASLGFLGLLLGALPFAKRKN